MKNDDMPMWDDPAEPSYVHELLEAGRNAPSDYDGVQGLATHLAHVQAGTPLPHWAQTGASAGMSSGALVAWIALPVVTASIVAGLYYGSARTTPPSAAASGAPQTAQMAQAPGATELAAAPSVQLPVAVATHSAATQLPSSQSKLVAARKAARAMRAEDRNDGSSAKSLLDTKSTPAVSVRTSPAATITARTQPQTSTPRAPSEAHALVEPRAAQAEPATAPEKAVQPTAAPPAELSESRLEREMQMLAVAQRVLSEDPDRALRMAQQGEREFPKSMFSAERQQVALLAMVKLGRIDDARRIGQPFLAKYPNAPWSARLRRALATGRVE